MNRQKRMSVAAALAAVAAACTSVPSAHAAADNEYVALGDSYSAGNGTRDQVDDCYRSPYGYPALLAKSANLSLDYQACSGATTATLLSDQLGTLSPATDYVTLTIGGNDVGFTSVITQCLLPSWLGDCDGALATAVSTLNNQLPGRYDAVFAAIKAKAPNAKVVVAGYPHLFNGWDCNLLTFFTRAEQRKLNSSTSDLNALTRSKATGAGFRFVDAVPSFKGHAVCDWIGGEWINGLTLPTLDAFHPNRKGNVGYANLISPALTGAAGSVRMPKESSATAQRSQAQESKAEATSIRALKLSSPANLKKAKAAGLNAAEITRLDGQLASADPAVVQGALDRLQTLDAKVRN